MKQVSMKQVGFIVLIGIILMSGYHFYRQAAANPLADELREGRTKITRKQLEELEVLEQSRLLPKATDLASFVESLYDCAQSAGVTDHEVTTSKQREQVQKRRSRKSQRQSVGDGLKTNRLQISLSGDFRSLAEYLRKLQELDRLKQIDRFDITPDKGSLKMSLLLDLYSLKGLDES